jgi:Cu/Zn superoxide dismutase
MTSTAKRSSFTPEWTTSATIPDRYSTGVPPIAGPDATTKATGDSGGRIACGIIDVD